MSEETKAIEGIQYAQLSITDREWLMEVVGRMLTENLKLRYLKRPDELVDQACDALGEIYGRTNSKGSLKV